MCGGLGSSLALVGAFGFALPLLAGMGGLLLLFRARGEDGAGEGAARALLDRRLALGEISAEDYFERESALRSTSPASRPRRPWS